MTAVAFIGLGAMGAPMAQQVRRAGHRLRVYDPDPAATEGFEAAESPADAADAADIVICMLPHPDVLKQVLLGETGVINATRSPGLVVDMSTSGPLAVRECGERLAEKGIGLVDAPVGKGPWAAEKGDLTVLLSGDDALCDRAETILRHIGSTIHRCGPLGSGQAIKLANNLASCANIVIAVEAWALAVRAGADPGVLTEVMPQTSADSWQLRNTLIAKSLRGDFEPMFRLGLAHKDMKLVLELAGASGTRVDAAEGAFRWYQDALDAGHADLDWGAVALLADPELADRRLADRE